MSSARRMHRILSGWANPPLALLQARTFLFDEARSAAVCRNPTRPTASVRHSRTCLLNRRTPTSRHLPDPSRTPPQKHRELSRSPHSRSHTLPGPRVLVIPPDRCYSALFRASFNFRDRLGSDPNQPYFRPFVHPQYALLPPQPGSYECNGLPMCSAYPRLYYLNESSTPHLMESYFVWAPMFPRGQVLAPTATGLENI